MRSRMPSVALSVGGLLFVIKSQVNLSSPLVIRRLVDEHVTKVFSSKARDPVVATIYHKRNCKTLLPFAIMFS